MSEELLPARTASEFADCSRCSLRDMNVPGEIGVLEVSRPLGRGMLAPTVADVFHRPGARRRWAAAVAAAMAMVAVSGFTYGVTSPGVCLSSLPSSADSYAWVFAQRSGVWSGGDSSHPVKVGADTYWLFGDSSMDNGTTFVNNSIVRQHGRCFKALTVGTRLHRLAPLQASSTGFLWPDGGVYDAARHKLFVLSDRVTLRPGGEPGWNFNVVGSDVTTVSFVSASRIDGAKSVPSPAPQHVPGLSWESVIQDGQWVYMYGRVGESHHVVARATVATFATGPWSYWTGLRWSRYWSTRKEMSFDLSPAAALAVVKVQGGYMASASAWGIISDDVWAWFSPTAQGPWQPLGKVADLRPPRTEWITYGAAIRWLPGAGWTVVWSQNAFHMKDSDWHIYGPRFAKVTASSVLRLKPRP